MSKKIKNDRIMNDDYYEAMDAMYGSDKNFNILLSLVGIIMIIVMLLIIIPNSKTNKTNNISDRPVAGITVMIDRANQ